jgi:hypothetical protein
MSDYGLTRSILFGLNQINHRLWRKCGGTETFSRLRRRGIAAFGVNRGYENLHFCSIIQAHHHPATLTIAFITTPELETCLEAFDHPMRMSTFFRPDTVAPLCA